MECVNASKIRTAEPLGFVAFDWNSGRDNPTYTSFKDKGAIVGNPNSLFFSSGSIASPAFPSGGFKPAERKSGWLLFQIDDRATKVGFGIMQQLTTSFDFKMFSVSKKDPKYLREDALLCRKFEYLDYGSSTCLLATLGEFDI